MRFYEIQYTINDCSYSTIVRPPEIRTEQYHESVLNVIECLTNAGAQVIGLREVIS